MKLLLAGYFGCGNLGDDAILLGFVNSLSSKDYQVKVLCSNVEALMRNYGLTGVHRKEVGAINDAISECDALVFPGGSIFQDVTSTRSVAYYSKLATSAKKAGKKVIMLAQGVGPLTGFFGKQLAASAFNAADAVVVRDPSSVSVLKAIGYKGRPSVSADMAWLLPSPNVEEAQAFGIAGSKTVGISARPWGKDRNKQVIQVFGELARLLTMNGYIPTFIEMDQAEDGPLILEIAKTQGGKVPDMRNMNSPKNVQQRIARMEGIIAMRLHAGILAATVGVPPFMVSYDPKVNAFANAIGAPTPPNMQGLTAQRVFDGFVGYIKDRDRTSASLLVRRAELAKEAMVNIEVLESTLRG